MQRPLGRNSPLMEDEDLIRRRKMAAEKRVQERHRALLAEQKQKNRTVAEERQRLLAERREREAREMKKRQEELHQHLEWLERDKARKKEILERQHAATSRTAKKDGVGFGSSTPRELSYLNHLPKNQKAYDKKLTPPPEPRLTPTKTPTPKRTAPSMMTTSMYVPSSTPRRPPPAKVQVPQPKTRPAQNMMTQSVYTPSPRAIGMTASAPRATLRPSPAARLPPAKRTPTKTPAQEKPSTRQISTVRESPIPSPRTPRNVETPAVPEINIKSSPLEEAKIMETTVSSEEENKSKKIEELEAVKLVDFHEDTSINSMDEASDLESVVIPKREEVQEQKDVEENKEKEIHQEMESHREIEPKEMPVEEKEPEMEVLSTEIAEHHEIIPKKEEKPENGTTESLIDFGDSHPPQETQKSVIFTMESTEIEPLEHIENGVEELKEVLKKEEHKTFFDETHVIEEFTLPGAVPDDYSNKNEGISLADELSFALSGEKPESVDESKLATSRPPSPPVATKNEEAEEIQRRREADQKHNDEVKARFAAVKARIGRVSPPNTKAEGLPPPVPVAAPAAVVENGKPLSDSTAALLSRLSKMGALKSTKAAESVENLLTRHASDPKIDNAPDDPVSLI